MSLQSFPEVGGRCTGCGRFIAKDQSHFHETEKRKFRGPPRAHLWEDGGGMVTRCDDVERAAQRIRAKYRHVEGASQEEAEEMFPIGKAVVQRGRCQPDWTRTYSWVWHPEEAHAKGLGVTTAVVWYEPLF